MKKVPESITVCKLDCLLMPQGEIICKGGTIGWFKNLKEHLSESTPLEAAAPDLLEALKAMQKQFFLAGSGVHIAGGLVADFKTIDENAKNAIAKAENA